MFKKLNNIGKNNICEAPKTALIPITEVISTEVAPIIGPTTATAEFPHIPFPTPISVEVFMFNLSRRWPTKYEINILPETPTTTRINNEKCEYNKLETLIVAPNNITENSRICLLINFDPDSKDE